MARFLVLKLLLLVNFMHQAFCGTKYECLGEYEVYGGSATCQKTCAGYPTSCDSRVTNGCVCRESFVREFEGGKCIPIEWCPKPDPDPVENGREFEKHLLERENTAAVCKKNETFSPDRATCEATCENRNRPFECDEMVPGCVCREGFIRMFPDGGPCIPSNQCPIFKCWAPEELGDFVRCQHTCDTTKPYPCDGKRRYGCICQPGFIRERRDGRCIPLSQCQILGCGPHEVASDRICEETCGRRDTLCKSHPGCQCEIGYARLKENGPCILFELCPDKTKPSDPAADNSREFERPLLEREHTTAVPNEDAADTRINHRLPETSAERNHLTSYKKVCKETEEYVIGTASCQETCVRRHPFMCPRHHISGCVCKQGFIRQDLNGPCIPIHQCPSTGCDDDTEKYSTDIACERTCDYPEGLDEDFCFTLPIYRGCACKEGFVRENLFGKCIPADKCPVVPEDVQCHKEHEKYRLYGNNCEPTCKNKLGTMYCTPLPQGACHCPYELGYVRADNGSCILATECPEEPCFPEVEYVYPTYD